MKPALPLISIYIPTRNRQTLLTRALNSVLAQDHAPLEVIVVDDGSTDATLELLSQWSRDDPRVRVLRQERQMGAAAARNLAIHAARGEFITGLDDDDWFEPTRISTFLAAWQRHEKTGEPAPAFLYGADISHSARGIHTLEKPTVASVREVCMGNCVGNQVFAPKETWVQSGGFDPSLAAWQDLDMWLRMLGKQRLGRYVPEAVQHIDVTHGSGRISQIPRQQLALVRDHVIAANRHLSSSEQFNLYCQMYSEYYGHIPGWHDISRALYTWPSLLGARRLLSLRRKRQRQQRKLAHTIITR